MSLQRLAYWRYVPSHFDGGSEHATRFCEIRSSPRPNRAGLVCRRWSPSRGRNGSELHGRHHHRWLDMGLRIWSKSCCGRPPESRKPKKVRKLCSKVKDMLIVFDVEVTVHSDYVPQYQTVIQHYCVEVLKWLRLAVCRKRPKKREPHLWPQHHENVPADKVHSVQFPIFKKILAFLSFSNHPDMASCDFGCFLTLRSHEKERDPTTLTPSQGIRRNTLAVLRKSHSKIFPTLTEPLALLDSFRSSLFWSGLTVCICKK